MVGSRETLFPFAWVTRAEDRGVEVADETLIRRVATGDEHAFAELLVRYERRLAQFVRWSLDTTDDIAEDALQEVLLQLHRSAPRFGGQSSFRTWMYALARNVCRHQRRKLRRQPSHIGESDELLRDVADERLGPLDSMAHDEIVRTVRRAVAALPARYRVALMLRDWEDLSYAEIADVLGIPVGTVRSRLHNARALLAERLSDRRFEK
jgi:RNA polymerase sigma-70 factor, ECF subfamily